MRTHKNAEQNLVKAIYILYENDVFPDILQELRTQVLPIWRALNDGSVSGHFPTWDYRASTADRQRRQEKYNSALEEWVKRFNFTANGSLAGTYPWILEFVEYECRRARDYVRPDSVLYTESVGMNVGTEPSRTQRPKAVRMGLGPPSVEWTTALSIGEIPRPQKGELFEDFWLRIQPAIKKAARRFYKHGKPRKAKTSFVVADNRRRKRAFVHYEWYVLKHFASRNAREIADSYSQFIVSVDEDTVRKGVYAVEKELLERSAGN